jgi:23S rRNA pseudouridine2605 synthase
MKGYKPGYVPLERALSKLGIASRTQAREWIEAGKVRVNGVLRTNPLFGVVPETARIEIGGAQVEAASRRTLLLYKPRGVVTTHSDEKGRPTVFSLIQEPTAHFIAVGRLDWATSGLLILTNDTRLAAWLTDPANEVPRVYLVSVRGEVAEAELDRAREGIQDKDELLVADGITLRKASKRESHLVVQLKEGKNREIRRMFAALGHEVTKLKRVSYGGLELGDLEPGKYRELSEEELGAAFPGAPVKAR